MDTTRATPAGEQPQAAPWEIRTATADQLRAFAAPLASAFTEEITEAEYDDWFRTAEPERWISAFEGPDGRDALGCAAAYTFRLTVPGGEVAAAGVTGVGVRPDHHRRGILRALMRHQLDDVRARGEPVAVLWASEGAIYQRFGYGLATMSGTLEVDRGRTAYARPAPPEGRMRLLDEEGAMAAFPPLYDAMRRATPGAIARTEEWWRSGPIADREYARRGAGPKYRYLYEVGGVAEGYAMFRVKSEWDHRGSKSQLEVHEAITLTPRAVRDVWRFLFEVDLVRTVRAGRIPVPHPLQHLLAEPRALGLVVGDGIWLRVVDLPGALAERRYGTADTLVLEVADAFCPWNAGRWRLATAGEPGAAEGRATPSDAEPDLVLDTTDLAAAYLGGVRWADLAGVGRVEERTPGAARRADALFAAERTPWCVLMF
jgi:predicted acetyltransferase